MIVLPVQFCSLLVNAHVDGMIPRMTENEYYIITLFVEAAIEYHWWFYNRKSIHFSIQLIKPYFN